ncbi:MAG: hypothetical protein P9M08_10455 [Candidatus Erginobacter occultus]|nr:hypothetical protein [Candidatus Erginobacter occultus]
MIVGQRHDIPSACLIVLAAVAATVLTMLALKLIHDYVRPRREPLIQRYIEIAGRVTALFIGTVSVEMIMRGIRIWVGKF